MSMAHVEALFDTRADLLAKLDKFQRDEVADIAVARVQRVMEADERRDAEYEQFDMIHAPERWDSDWDVLCA